MKKYLFFKIFIEFGQIGWVWGHIFFKKRIIFININISNEVRKSNKFSLSVTFQFRKDSGMLCYFADYSHMPRMCTVKNELNSAYIPVGQFIRTGSHVFLALHFIYFVHILILIYLFILFCFLFSVQPSPCITHSSQTFKHTTFYGTPISGGPNQLP